MPGRYFSAADPEGQWKLGLGEFIVRWFGWSARLPRARISDLPANLRRDIGLEPKTGHGSSFEQRWREEIDRMQRR